MVGTVRIGNRQCRPRRPFPVRKWDSHPLSLAVAEREGGRPRNPRKHGRASDLEPLLGHPKTYRRERRVSLILLFGVGFVVFSRNDISARAVRCLGRDGACWKPALHRAPVIPNCHRPFPGAWPLHRNADLQVGANCHSCLGQCPPVQ
jgi:hypothetical protein